MIVPRWRAEIVLDRVQEAEYKRIQATDTSHWGGTVDDLIALCHPKQRDFVLDPSRRIAALCGRGGGKTTGGFVRLLRRMLTTPGARCCFIATTRQHASELIWERLKEVCAKAHIAGRFQETALKLTLPRNNAQLRLVGADDMKEIGKLRGLPFHEVGIDEGSVHKPQIMDHLIYRIIAPRLGDYNGCLWMIGTPEHMQGPFYDATRNGSEISRLYSERDRPEYEGWNGWSLHKWGLRDGAPHVKAMDNLWKEALIEKEANGWSDDHPVWRREYLGEWAADNTDRVYRYVPHDPDTGEPFNQWAPELWPGFGGDGAMFAKMRGPEWSYVYAMDFGWSDAFALGVFAFKEGERKLYHCGEVVRKEMYARKIAELLIGEELDASHPSPNSIIGRTGWPIGMVADRQSGGDAIMTELRRVYGINLEPADKKNKHDSIELANGDFIDGRLVVMKGSVLEQQCLELQWDVDEYGKLRERRDMPNDAADCMIYARRKANHLLANIDERPPRPPKHSIEARALEMDESERRMATPASDDDLLFDDDYDMEWDHW